MKHILLILALGLTACSSDPIVQDTTTRAVEPDTTNTAADADTTHTSIPLQVDTTWGETISIPW